MTQHRRSHTEPESLAELASTQVGPWTARFMSWLFVVLIVAVPLGQVLVEARAGQVPEVLAVFRPLADAVRRAGRGRVSEAWAAAQPLFSAGFLHAYEDELERTSPPRRFVQPRLQLWLTSVAGYGNDRCVVGRDGWLFYQPDVAYLTGPDLLDQGQLRLRQKKFTDRNGTTEAWPDPRPAILKLQEDCRRAGVYLVLVPVPDKASLQPAQLTNPLDRSGVLPVVTNAGYGRLLAELREQGVDVFDLAPAMVRANDERYLAGDTHWTPAYMEQSAYRLAEHLRSTVPLPPPSRYCRPVVRTQQVTGRGDLVRMLRLPREQRQFSPQTVTIHQVIDPAVDGPWEPDPRGDVLLLGDSFTNIYSDRAGEAGLGWGQGAGFAAQLSLLLGRPIDVIARNGSAATQTRAELARRPDPLGGKRILVWEFAVRDLAQAAWTPIPLPAPRSPGTSDPVEDTGPVVADVTVVYATPTPRPFTVPYKDCLTFVRVHVDRVEQGNCRQDQVIAAFWGLRDNHLEPGSQHVPGEHLRLRLVPLAQVTDRLRAVQYADGLNDYLHRTYYVEEEHTP